MAESYLVWMMAAIWRAIKTAHQQILEIMQKQTVTEIRYPMRYTMAGNDKRTMNMNDDMKLYQGVDEVRETTMNHFEGVR
ncbi:MAG: hypothetical protein ACYCS8_05825 [Acidithiobacillus sp.]